MRAHCREEICGHIENIKYQLSAVWQMFSETISSVRTAHLTAAAENISSVVSWAWQLARGNSK